VNKTERWKIFSNRLRRNILDGGSGIMKVLELKEDGQWWFAVIKQEGSFVPGSFESEITMWSDDGVPHASPLEGAMYGIDKNTGKRQLYAFLFSRRFDRKYVQRLIELIDVEAVDFTRLRGRRSLH